jgi:hypothetical protein
MRSRFPPHPVGLGRGARAPSTIGTVAQDVEKKEPGEIALVALSGNRVAALMAGLFGVVVATVSDLLPIQ